MNNTATNIERSVTLRILERLKDVHTSPSAQTALDDAIALISARADGSPAIPQLTPEQELQRDAGKYVIATRMDNLVTPKQLVAIRAIANAHGHNAENVCLELLKCRPEELTKRAASALIDYLKKSGATMTMARTA